MTKITVPEVLPYVNAIYQKQSTGCCLHILTEDGNVHDIDAKGCYEFAQQRRHQECMDVATLLMQMTSTQRHRIYQLKNR